MVREIAGCLLAAALAISVSGCGIRAVGLAPLSPPLESRTFSRWLRFTPVDSLTPTLRWEALDARTLDATGAITDITYELRVWTTTTDYSGSLVYARDGLLQPFHQMEEPLQPGTRYLWTVRARFTFAGQPWLTEWGMAGNPLRDQVVPNASCFRFETPPGPDHQDAS